MNFPPSELEDFTNIILLIIDGLGHDFLKDSGANTIFNKFSRAKMTSVFPSTTAAAMTTFHTGVAPHNHGVPSWFTYLRELGVISVILPMEIRGWPHSILNNQVKAKDILQHPSFYEKLNVERHYVMPSHLVRTPYISEILGNTNQAGFRNLKEFFTTITSIVKSSSQPKFICGYWPMFDAKAHGFGVNSKRCVKHLVELDKNFNIFMEKITEEASQSRIIITADHGLIDAPPEHVIHLEEHPALHSCLTLPISGEARCPFFYVRPSRVNQLEKYCLNDIEHVGTLIKSEELIKNNLFGLFDPHPRIFDRVGDYVLIMNKDYVLFDKLLNEQQKSLIGNHGGLSSEEMHVPLIVI
jgi:predicted AlkP superfamily pyrophosphatase or phosphodiesterase